MRLSRGSLPRMSSALRAAGSPGRVVAAGPPKAIVTAELVDEVFRLPRPRHRRPGDRNTPDRARRPPPAAARARPRWPCSTAASGPTVREVAPDWAKGPGHPEAPREVGARRIPFPGGSRVDVVVPTSDGSPTR
jgi:hypothetical protein